MRTAYNMIIYEALDFTVGLFDADGNTDLHRPRAADVHPRPVGCDQGQDRALGQGEHRARRHPAHQRQLHHGHPPEPHDLHPADLLHGELVAFRSSMAHWQDIGGSWAASPGTFLRGAADADRRRSTAQGVQNDEMIEIIKANVRFPDLAMGDFRAQIAGDQDRRAALPAAAPALRARRGVLGSIQQIYRQSDKVARAGGAADPRRSL